VTIFIPEFISLLSDSSLAHQPHTFPIDTISHPSDPVRLYLLGTLKAQIDALLKYQDPESGLWHTLLDDPSTYLEASGSAGFAFGMLEAVRKGFVGGASKEDKERYEMAALRALKGVVSRIDDDGELKDVR
jgi:unsaturated rhamnogalacturonyl hydrolase